MSEKIYNRLNGFTITDNDIIVNRGLSIEAIGLYVVISSKPDSWDFSYRGLLSQLPNIKEKQLRRVVKELVLAHALVRHKAVIKRKSDGFKYAGFNWIVNPTDEDIERAKKEDPILKLLKDGGDQNGGDQNGGDQNGGDQNGGDQKGEDKSNTKTLSKKEISKKEGEKKPPAQNSDSFPFFEEEFGTDEQSNHISRPSLNQTKAEAKRLNIVLSVAQSFWLHYESTAWRGVVDWVPKLRKWAMDEQSKYGKAGESTEPTSPPAPKVERPTTVEELKLWFTQLPKEQREKIAIKTRTGAMVRVNSRGVLVVQEDWGDVDDWYALESDSMEKMMVWMVDGFDERVRVA